MENRENLNRATEAIDLAVKRSSAELEKLIKFYHQIGRVREAREILETLNRLSRRQEDLRRKPANDAKLA